MSDEIVGRIDITSEPDEQGVFHLTISLNPDHQHALDTDGAIAYAREVMAVAMEAEYDAAVLRQITQLVGEKEAAGVMVKELRAERGPSPRGAIPGLVLTPGVSKSSEQGFIALQFEGKRVGQWEVADAKGHAAGVLECLENLRLDAAFYRCLLDHDIDKDRALAAVCDVINHRD